MKNKKEAALFGAASFLLLILFIELFRHIISFYNKKKLIFFILFGKNIVHSYRYKS